MHTLDLRRQFDLLGKEVKYEGLGTRHAAPGTKHLNRWLRYSLIAFFSLLFVRSATAQSTVYQKKYMEFYDDKKVHYGFLWGLPSFTRFNVRHSEAFVNGDSTASVTSPPGFGVKLGFIVNVYLSRRFDLRFSPLTVNTTGRSLDYRFTNGSERTETRDYTFAEFPVMLKYKSERRGNTRMYLTGGFRYSTETGIRFRRANSANKLETKSRDLAVEYGVGVERFFQYFKFSPELIFSHGLTNMFQSNRSPYSVGINRLTSHTVTLYLNFE
jgi:hypothetical protein